MTHTEKVALAMAWYDSGLEDRAAFQTLMESLFAQPEQEPCVHAKNPKGCYRVRCQLGDKCVDDEMSFRTAPPQRTWVGLTDDEVNNFAAGCHLGKSVQGAIYEAEAKLKEKNT